MSVTTLRARAMATGVSAKVGGLVRHFRRAHRYSQQDLAELMQQAGHPWLQRTVSDVERGLRRITVDELVGLVVMLGISVRDLLPDIE